MAHNLLPSNSIILIVDQAKAGRNQLKEALGQLGYHYVIEAESTTDALAKIEVGANTGSPITLIFCEWKVVNVKGFDFLLKIRSSYFSTSTPVIVISSNNELSNMLMAVSKQIDGYVIKPYTPESLKLNLDAALTGIKL